MTAIGATLAFIVALYGIRAFADRRDKEVILAKSCEREYCRINTIIKYAPTVQGLEEITDDILDMKNTYRKVEGINDKTGRLFAALENRKSKLI